MDTTISKVLRVIKPPSVSLAFVAADSFPFQAEIEHASEKAGERRCTPGVSKKLGRSGERVWRKEVPPLASPPPSASYFSYSLPVSFLSRKGLETPATQATVSLKGIVTLISQSFLGLQFCLLVYRPRLFLEKHWRHQDIYIAVFFLTMAVP